MQIKQDPLKQEQKRREAQHYYKHVKRNTLKNSSWNFRPYTDSSFIHLSSLPGKFLRGFFKRFFYRAQSWFGFSLSVSDIKQVQYNSIIILRVETTRVSHTLSTWKYALFFAIFSLFLLTLFRGAPACMDTSNFGTNRYGNLQ